MGGGDYTEDINSAMQLAVTHIQWVRRINIIIHICDAPCKNIKILKINFLIIKKKL